MRQYALGLIETKGLIGSIEACDAASKAAAVVVATAELTEAAFMTLKIEGELSAVQAAVDAGAHAAEQVGELVSAHVIPRPDNELQPMLPERRYISKYHPHDNRPPFGTDEDDNTPPAPTIPRAPKPPVRPAPVDVVKDAPKTEKRKEDKPVTKPPDPKPESPKPKPQESILPLSELEAMSVVKLRRYARTLKNLGIKGRQISMANKTKLLEEIKKIIDLE